MSAWSDADREAQALVAEALVVSPAVANELSRLRWRVRHLEFELAGAVDPRRAYEAGYRHGYGNGHYDGVNAKVEGYNDSPEDAYDLWDSTDYGRPAQDTKFGPETYR